jgi:catechol 2,3-dioxygenase-like lactoylglutathione lyase family enzyme
MLTSISISQIFVPDQDAALHFYVDQLGFEVQTDMAFGPMRFLTVALPSDPGHAVLLEKPGPPGYSEETAAQVRDLVSKGAGGGHLFFTTDDCRKTYDELVLKGVEFTQEPVEQPYGIDCGLRDPFGNHIRFSQPIAVTTS